MIVDVINKLSTNDFYNVSESVEIAKGKYQLTNSFKIAKRKIKRAWLLQKK
tara:strand:+ start:694 stop:846 length:153 start_codon:yes stop_codon:yes gene_type:complete